MRVRVYVDGFNLYYRALRGTPFKWLDLHKLAVTLLDDDDAVDMVRYFTARVSSRAGDEGAGLRQQTYLSALGGNDLIKIHYGRFLPKRKRRPLADDPGNFVDILDTEEKGSDVNLATYLLHDGWSGRYDAALVLSQDTDLCEPLRLVRDELKKPVGVVWLDGREPGTKFRRCTSFVRHLTPSRLRAAQLPEWVRNRSGRMIAKPDGW